MYKAEPRWQKGKTCSPCLPTTRLLTRHWWGTSDNQEDGRNSSNQVGCQGSKEKRGSGSQTGPAHMRGSRGRGVVLTPREVHLSLGICIGKEAPSWVGGPYLEFVSPYTLGPGSYLRLLCPPAPLCLSGYKGHGREVEEENLGQLGGPLLGWRIRGSACSSVAHSAPSSLQRPQA